MANPLRIEHNGGRCPISVTTEDASQPDRGCPVTDQRAKSPLLLPTVATIDRNARAGFAQSVRNGANIDATDFVL